MGAVVDMAPVLALVRLGLLGIWVAAMILLIAWTLRGGPDDGPDDDEEPGPWEPDPGGLALRPRRAFDLAA